MGSISSDLKELLMREGAALVGFGDINEIVREQDGHMKYGVSVAVAMTPGIVKGIEDGPTEEYYEEYKKLNSLLDHLVGVGAEFLQSKGYKAIAQTNSIVKATEDNRTTYPHKSFATRAGLGWIGKCALLITKEYGSAVRLSSIITDAPLEAGEPINNSKCGSCMVCPNACPGRAVSGEEWDVSKDRESFFQADLCKKQARLRAAKVGIEATICGKCIQVCPYTQRYIKG